MAPPISIDWQRSTRLVSTPSLSETFAPADDGHEGLFGLVQDLAEMVELLVHQEARARVAHEADHARGRGVSPVRGAERVVDVDVDALGERARELLVVLFFAGLKTQVLEKQAPDRRAGRQMFFRTPSPTQSSAKITSRPSKLARCAPTGSSEKSGLRFPLGRPRCDASTTRAPWSIAWWIVGSAARMRVSSSHVAFGRERHVEVDPDERRATLQFEVTKLGDHMG